MRRFICLLSIGLFVIHILKAQIPQNYFIHNFGQWKGNVKYVAFGTNLTFFITNEALYFDHFTIQKQDSISKKNGTVVKFQIENAKFKDFIEVGKSQWKLNFFYGNNPLNWYKDIYGAKKILILNVIENVDLVLTSDPYPRYDFIVHKNGNPNNIKIKIEGANIVQCNKNEIVLETAFGKIFHRNLLVYQQVDSNIKQIEASFVQFDKNTFGFEVMNYNKNQDLIIDPLVLCTLIGGSQAEEIVDIVEPVQGSVIVTGWTESINFPTKPGAYSTTYSGEKDIFISKFNVKGSSRELIFSSFLGGAANDVPVNVLVDQNDNIYVAATTNSNDLPLVKSLSKSSYGLNDAYVCKFNPDCNEIIFSTFFGGSKDDILTAAKLSGDNGIYLTGYTNSTDLPVTGGAYQDKLKGKNDIFFAKISNTGQAIRTCTYFGGIEDDFAYDMCVTPSEYVYIGGATKSNDFPAFPVRVYYYGSYEYVLESPFDRTYNGNFDGVVMKILGASGALEYASFFGGLADDFVTAVGYYGTDEKVVFAGKTYKEPSTITFPITQTAYQNTIKGQAESFVASLSNINITSYYGYTYKNQNLVFSTFLGGSGTDVPIAITFNKGTQTFYIIGYTNSTNFPIVNNPNARNQQKNDIFFVSMLNDGSGLAFSNIIGGDDDDFPSAIYLNYAGDYYIVGSTSSSNFPIVYPINDISGEILPDAFILKNVDATIRFEAPFQGDKFCPGANVTVKWGIEGMTQPDSFDIEIKPETTEQWCIVASNVKGFSKTITIPQNITGKVWIRVSHPKGLIATISGPIIVLEPPKLFSFLPEGENLELCEGDSITFSVHATGSDLHYQWYVNNKQIPNATDSIIYLKNLEISNSGKYKVVISGTCPPSVESNEISLNVLPATKITSQSGDITLKIGDTMRIYVQSQGVNLKYQWFKNDIKLLGENKNTFQIASVSKYDEGIYYCVVEGTCGRDTSRRIFVSIDTNITKVSFDLLEYNLLVNQIDNKLLIKNKGKITICSNITISIYNILGEKVLYKFIPCQNLNEIILDISSFPLGSYLLTIQSSNLNKSILFFKQ